MNDLPLELLEIVLMRTFVMLYSTDFEADDDDGDDVVCPESESGEDLDNDDDDCCVTTDEDDEDFDDAGDDDDDGDRRRYKVESDEDLDDDGNDRCDSESGEDFDDDDDDGDDHFVFEAHDDVTPYTPTTAGVDERPQRVKPVKPGKSRDSECRAFTMLASVCSYWYFTLTGWPHSPTPGWVRHRIKKRIERECHTLR